MLRRDLASAVLESPRRINQDCAVPLAGNGLQKAFHRITLPCGTALTCTTLGMFERSRVEPTRHYPKFRRRVKEKIQQLGYYPSTLHYMVWNVRPSARSTP